MQKRWIARPYCYADNQAWNPGRKELFIWKDGEWFPVGGAMLIEATGRSVAFLCTRTANRTIRKPGQVQAESNGLFVLGTSLREALDILKFKYPDPERTLAEAEQQVMAAF